MRRIQLVLAALAIVVTSLAAFSGPAIADDLDCRNAKGKLIRCDGDLYAPYNRGSYYDNNDYYYPPLYSPFYNAYNYGGYDEDDFEGYYNNW